MSNPFKKLLDPSYNILAGYPFQKDIRKELLRRDALTPRSIHPPDEEVGLCEIRFDDGRPTYISDVKVRRIACRQTGLKVAKNPGTLV